MVDELFTSQCPVLIPHLVRYVLPLDVPERSAARRHDGHNVTTFKAGYVHGAELYSYLGVSLSIRRRYITRSRTCLPGRIYRDNLSVLRTSL